MTQTTNTQPKPRKLRGTGIFAGDEFTFQPCEPGDPTQVDIKTCAGGKLYHTTNEKKPLKVAHLTCPADATDPYSEYVSQLERLGIKPQNEKRLPEKQRVVNEGGVEVYLNSKEGVLTFQGCINLHQAPNWQSEVMRLLQIIVRTLPINKKFTTVLSQLKKGGKKS